MPEHNKFLRGLFSYVGFKQYAFEYERKARLAGKTKYPFIVEFGGMWLIRILATYIGIHYFNQGLVYVWCCMIADNIIKATLLTIPLPRLWKKVENL